MPTYDLIMLGLLFLAVIFGARRGLIWQAAPITALILGYVVAYPISIDLAPYFGQKAPTNQFVALTVAYVVVAGFVYLIAQSMKRFLDKVEFGPLDRHLGALFGGIKGVIFCMVVTLFTLGHVPSYADEIFSSYSGYYAAIVLDRLHPYMPESIHEALEPHIHALDRPGMDLRHGHQTSEADHDHDADHDEVQEDRFSRAPGSPEFSHGPLDSASESRDDDTLSNYWDETDAPPPPRR